MLLSLLVFKLWKTKEESLATSILILTWCQSLSDLFNMFYCCSTVAWSFQTWDVYWIHFPLYSWVQKQRVLYCLPKTFFYLALPNYLPRSSQNMFRILHIVNSPMSCLWGDAVCTMRKPTLVITPPIFFPLALSVIFAQPQMWMLW